ncbi:hypothetical protein [Streptomyces sp. NEAU-174]|uniref:hypothetical protein n=1 Tax=Streptomyces sp. NEAU-174 TaxID=3458254 RepID=UPI0040447E90
MPQVADLLECHDTQAGGHPAALLDGTYREVVVRVPDNAQIGPAPNRRSFQLPDPPGGLRPLRDKHAADDQ